MYNEMGDNSLLSMSASVRCEGLYAGEALKHRDNVLHLW